MSNAQTKNSLPTFARGTLANIQQGISDGKIKAPAICFLTDDTYHCLSFYDIDGKFYIGASEKVISLEDQLGDLKEISTDPETGEPISVAQYVQETQTSVTTVTQQVSTLQEEVGKVLMIVDIGESEA